MDAEGLAGAEELLVAEERLVDHPAACGEERLGRRHRVEAERRGAEAKLNPTGARGVPAGELFLPITWSMALRRAPMMLASAG